MVKKILITGGCGFIGHHLVEYFLAQTDYHLVVLDKLSYASNGLNRLRSIGALENPRLKIFTFDLNCPISEGLANELGEFEYIINLAGESHIDNSLNHPIPFIQNNINLTLHLFEWAKTLKSLKKIIQFSTDEVFGSAPRGTEYSEGNRLNPSNPYSASKASQEMIARAYAISYGLPIVITNAMNVFGERQHPEKFIPLAIKKILQSESLFIHANAEKTIASSRFFIHAKTVAKALHFILEETDETLDKLKSDRGVFSIVGEEMDILTLAKIIANVLDKKLMYELKDFHSSRPGHDLRYALARGKLEKLGFQYPESIREDLIRTIGWFWLNKNWLK